VTRRLLAMEKLGFRRSRTLCSHVRVSGFIAVQALRCQLFQSELILSFKARFIKARKKSFVKVEI
jgi:hypothetical protein